MHFELKVKPPLPSPMRVKNIPCSSEVSCLTTFSYRLSNSCPTETCSGGKDQNRPSRDFQSRSIFDFFNNIGT
jgi:hypothetical protein